MPGPYAHRLPVSRVGPRLEGREVHWVIERIQPGETRRGDAAAAPLEERLGDASAKGWTLVVVSGPDDQRPGVGLADRQPTEHIAVDGVRERQQTAPLRPGGKREVLRKLVPQR